MAPYPRMPERCDYAVLRERFAGMFRRARHCVISVDLDGVLSSIMLSELFEWEVVGFYTLDDLFIERGILDTGERDLETALRKADLVFIDHDIYRSWIDSIGHHLLQWSPDTPIPLHTSGLASLNPNLLRGITKKQFQRKYPFGTFHFLLACANAWGVLREFDPDDIVTALLLQIDSSFINAMTYQENALDWLDWLGGSDEASPLNPVCRRLSQFTPRDILEQFRRLATQFSGFGIRPRSQASVTNPTDTEQMKRLFKLIDWFEKKTGWRSRFPNMEASRLVRLTMDRKATKPTKKEFLRVIEGRPFSYAIIGADSKGLNYSHFQKTVPSP